MGASADKSFVVNPLRDNMGLPLRSEEHTSELQSQSNLVCRLLLEKKKNRDRDDGLPGSHSWVRSFYENDIHLEPYKLGLEFSALIGATPCPPVLERDGLCLDVAPL